MAGGFYSEEELRELGLGGFGKNVLISRKASLYYPEKIFLGDNVRIDDFCILIGRIRMGNRVYLQPNCGLFSGDYGIEMESFTSLGRGTTLMTECDDYSGAHLFGPMVPYDCRSVWCGPVHMKRHSLCGVGCFVLPGLTLEEGSVVGAMSMVKESLEPWTLYAGVPAKKIRANHRDSLQMGLELDALDQRGE